MVLGLLLRIEGPVKWGWVYFSQSRARMFISMPLMGDNSLSYINYMLCFIHFMRLTCHLKQSNFICEIVEVIFYSSLIHCSNASLTPEEVALPMPSLMESILDEHLMLN